MNIERELQQGLNEFTWDGENNYLVNEILNTNGSDKITEIIGVGEATNLIFGEFRGSLTKLISGNEYTFKSNTNFTWIYPANIENQDETPSVIEPTLTTDLTQDQTQEPPLTLPPIDDENLILETSTTPSMVANHYFASTFITLGVTNDSDNGFSNPANDYFIVPVNLNQFNLVSGGDSRFFQIFDDMSVFENLNGIGLYIQIFDGTYSLDNQEFNYELIYVRSGTTYDEGTYDFLGAEIDRNYHRYSVDRGVLGTVPLAHVNHPQVVRIFDGVPQFIDNTILNEEDNDTNPTINNLTPESQPQDFGPEGIQVEQTLFKSVDINSAINLISPNDFENTEQSLNLLNEDKRIPLGLFFFKEDNFFSQKFDIQLSDEKFKQIEQVDLLKNGDCKFTEKTYLRDNNNNAVVVKPGGNWRYNNADGYKCMYTSAYQNFEVTNYVNYILRVINTSNQFNGTNSLGQTYINESKYFPQHSVLGEYIETGDKQNGYLYGGFLPYCPLNNFNNPNVLDPPVIDEFEKYIKHVQSIYWVNNTVSEPYTNNQETDENTNEVIQFNNAKDFFIEFLKRDYRIPTDETQLVYLLWNLGNDNSSFGGWGHYTNHLPAGELEGSTSANLKLPIFATWIQTNRAFSNDRCLLFQNYETLDLGTNPPVSRGMDTIFETRPEDEVSEAEYETALSRGIRIPHFSTTQLYPHNLSDTEEAIALNKNNEYRFLNQVQKIYDLNDESILPYTPLKVKLKIKTEETQNIYNNGNESIEVNTPKTDAEGNVIFPKIEVGVTSLLGRDMEPGSPRTRIFPHSDGTAGSPVSFPKGNFNSLKYGNAQNFDDQQNSFFGSSAIFANTILDTWQEFEFSFILGDNFIHGDNKVGSFEFFVQSGQDFIGRVLIDDMKVEISYDFIPDVDVRKKISPKNYGKADLTKYYDKELEPIIYQDTVGPMEAQFFFYPTYPTNEIFDVERTPIYTDFKNGMFYIYDVDWGDGSPNEFVSEPKQIDDETALYHNYETHGVFEITGYMLRLKPDEDYTPIGLIQNKKFRLRININEGINEDFDYFNDEGHELIPFNNVTPIIGGYSKQSIYYNFLKRSLGFLSDNLTEQTKVNFKNFSDRLKFEKNLLQMDSSFENFLPTYTPYLDKYVGITEDTIVPGLPQNVRNITDFHIMQSNGGIFTDIIRTNTIEVANYTFGSLDDVIPYQSTCIEIKITPTSEDYLYQLFNLPNAYATFDFGQLESIQDLKFMYLFGYENIEVAQIAGINPDQYTHEHIDVKHDFSSYGNGTTNADLRLDIREDGFYLIIEMPTLIRTDANYNNGDNRIQGEVNFDNTGVVFSKFNLPPNTINKLADNFYNETVVFNFLDIFNSESESTLLQTIENLQTNGFMSMLDNLPFPLGLEEFLTTQSSVDEITHTDVENWFSYGRIDIALYLLVSEFIKTQGLETGNGAREDALYIINTIGNNLQNLGLQGVQDFNNFIETYLTSINGSTIFELMDFGTSNYSFISYDELYVYPPYSLLENVELIETTLFDGSGNNSDKTETLGYSIGDCDITSLKFYNKPKSIWELFGFNEVDKNIIGTPDKARYWKNIIPNNYSVFDRDGIVENDTNFTIDIFSNQDWITYDSTTNLSFPIVDNNFNDPNNLQWDGYLSGTVQHGNDALIMTSDGTDKWFGMMESDVVLEYGEQYQIDATIIIPSAFQGNGTSIRIEHGGSFGYFIDETGNKFQIPEEFVLSADLNKRNVPQPLRTILTIPNRFDSTDASELPNNYDEGIAPTGRYYVRNMGEYPEPGDFIFLDNFSIKKIITTSQQFERPYYPVLPKFGSDGKFVNIKTNEDGEVIDGYPFVDHPNGGEEIKIPFPLEGDITNKNEINESLLINIDSNYIDNKTLNDNSGNQNYGHCISDFKPNVEKQSLKLKKGKYFSKIKTKTSNGAF